jgi:hypothetical protein
MTSDAPVDSLGLLYHIDGSVYPVAPVVFAPPVVQITLPVLVGQRRAFLAVSKLLFAQPEGQRPSSHARSTVTTVATSILRGFEGATFELSWRRDLNPRCLSVFSYASDKPQSVSRAIIVYTLPSKVHLDPRHTPNPRLSGQASMLASVYHAHCNAHVFQIFRSRCHFRG